MNGEGRRAAGRRERDVTAPRVGSKKKSSPALVAPGSGLDSRVPPFTHLHHPPRPRLLTHTTPHASTQVATPTNAPRPPRSINYEAGALAGSGGPDADFEAALRGAGFDKAHPEADIPAIVAAEVRTPFFCMGREMMKMMAGAPSSTTPFLKPALSLLSPSFCFQEAWTADGAPAATPPTAKKNPNITCVLNCRGETVISFDALAPASPAARTPAGLAWNASRGGLAFLARPAFGFARTKARVCFPNVTTTARDACFPIGSAGYTTNLGPHVAVISYTGPSATVTITGGVRNFKSAWVSNPSGPLAFKGYNLAGQLKCGGSIPASPGAAVDLASAGCCSVGLLTVGYVGGVTAAGTPFALGDVKLCKAVA